jgi:L-ascorbate metabolism protein UlaG (beta-lactamase superfamily)
MDLQYYGLSCFRIKTKRSTLVTDPFGVREVGISYPLFEADCVVYTGKGDSSKVKADDERVSKDLDLIEINEAGEYEVGGIFIKSFENPVFHIISMGEVSICYLGLLKGEIKRESFEGVGDIDYLIGPVGDGEEFVEWKTLDKLINEVDPAVFIPSCYKMDGMKGKYQNLKDLEDFLKELGISKPHRESKLKLKHYPESEDKQLSTIILEPKGK